MLEEGPRGISVELGCEYVCDFYGSSERSAFSPILSWISKPSMLFCLSRKIPQMSCVEILAMCNGGYKTFLEETRLVLLFLVLISF